MNECVIESFHVLIRIVMKKWSMPRKKFMTEKKIHSSGKTKYGNLGFSLVEILIVVAVLGGLSLVVMNLTKQSSKSSAKLQFDTDVTLTTNEINGILSDPARCLTTLGTTANPVSINNGKYYIKTVPPGDKGYGNSGLKIVSYTLTGTAPDGVLTLIYENMNILKGTAGPATISKIINIYIEGAPGTVTKCRSLSTSTTDVWTRGSGSDIYYNVGSIGIGTNTPAVKLDVNGSIRPSPETVGSACSPMGAQAYNASTGAPIYCNGTAWTESSSLNMVNGTNPTCPVGSTILLKYWPAQWVPVPGVGAGCDTAPGWSGTPVICEGCNNFEQCHFGYSTSWTSVICK